MPGPRKAPPIHFDGHFYWYTQWFDAEDDRCSKCRGLIDPDTVPLILFKDVGRETWQARFCDACMEAAFLLLKPRPKPRP